MALILNGDPNERRDVILTGSYDDEMLVRMQTPEAREGARKAFSATPEELGAAAVKGAAKKV
jgi:hypothetical protein